MHVLHTAVEARSASCRAGCALRGNVIQFGGISCLYAALRNEHLPDALTIEEPLLELECMKALCKSTL